MSRSAVVAMYRNVRTDGVVAGDAPKTHPPPSPSLSYLQSLIPSFSSPHPLSTPAAAANHASVMSLPALVAMCRNVRTDGVVAGDAPKTQQPPSRPLSCVRRRAIGFNFNTSTIADNVVNALRLEAHLADAPALSYLEIQGGGDGCIRILASGGTALQPLRVASLSLVPPGDDGSYALVSMAEMANHSDALYLWRSSSPKWNLVKAKFPSEFKGDYVAHSYTAVLAFSFGGRAFWANLVHGVMYCSCEALLSAPSRRGAGAILKFHFIKLPVEQPRQLPPHILCAMELRSNMYRTMGRVGESSIKFVSIDGFMQLLDFVDCT
uniref:Uncharacterized protein n=1 Tax=Avena sativa TaxID=4498 RepID=A0ACD5VQ34_AVESA